MSDIFGLRDTEDPKLDFLKDEVPTPEPEAEAQETTDEQEQPEQLQLPLEGLEEPAEQETVEEPSEEEPPAEAEPEPEHKWAGKYVSAEELEKGYKELRDLQRRTAERAKAAERQRLEIERRALELQRTLEQAVPYVQQALNKKPKDEDGKWLFDEEPTEGNAQLSPQQIQQMVEARFREMEAQRNQQTYSEQEASQAQDALSQFFSAHPDLEPDGEEDSRIAETIVSLHQAWESDGYALDLTAVENYELAYEASQRPALRKVLEMNPTLVASDEGLALARAQAEMVEQRLNPEAPAPKPESTTEQRRVPKKPIAESAKGAAPQKDERPLDEFDAAVQAYNKKKNRGSVFF